MLVVFLSEVSTLSGQLLNGDFYRSFKYPYSAELVLGVKFTPIPVGDRGLIKVWLYISARFSSFTTKHLDSTATNISFTF